MTSIANMRPQTDAEDPGMVRPTGGTELGKWD